ncbi:MAG: hypothetical protein AAGD07_21980 [Planctomycetota bacterium]
MASLRGIGVVRNVFIGTGLYVLDMVSQQCGQTNTPPAHSVDEKPQRDDAAGQPKPLRQRQGGSQETRSFDDVMHSLHPV